MPKILRTLILTLILSSLASAANNRFVHTDGKHIVAPNGEKLLLRGINLGNWLVPEGYMFHFEKGPASYREISALFNDLIGPDEACLLYTSADVGFGDVRVAILLPETRGLVRADQVVEQSRDLAVRCV